MNFIANTASNTLLPCIREYFDNPSSIEERDSNIEIVNYIVEKLIQINFSSRFEKILNFSDLKPSSQSLKNNILENMSVRILTQENKNGYAIHRSPRKYITSILAIGATVTDKAEQNLYAFYTQIMSESKTNTIHSSEYHIELANEVRGFLKPGRGVLTEIETKLDNQQKSTEELKKQVTSLQTQTNNIDRKITELSNNQCCVIC